MVEVDVPEDPFAGPKANEEADADEDDPEVAATAAAGLLFKTGEDSRGDVFSIVRGDRPTAANDDVELESLLLVVVVVVLAGAAVGRSEGDVATVAIEFE